MTKQNLKSLSIAVGGPNEDIADFAAEHASDLIIHRDNEGRYLRNYEATTKEIVANFAEANDLRQIGYDSPDMSYLDTDIMHTIDAVAAAHQHLRPDQKPLALAPSMYWGAVTLLVGHMADASVVISHHNDDGIRTAAERYDFAAADSTVARICEAIRTVLDTHNTTREDIERAVWAMLQGVPSEAPQEQEV